MNREEPADAGNSTSGPTSEQWKEWSNQRNDPDFKFNRKHPSLVEESDVDMSLDHVTNNDEIEEKKTNANNMNQTEQSPQ